jgi:transposase
MLTLGSNTRIFLCVTPVDMRKSFDSLAGLVEDVFNEDVFSGDLFVFRNREETKMKILYWEKDGYVLWYKRLEKGTFKLPAVAASCQVDRTAFTMLMNGVDAKQLKRQHRYSRPEQPQNQTSV